MASDGQYNYSWYNVDPLRFEKVFDHEAHYGWLLINRSISLWFAGVYIFLVFYGQHYMKNRPKYSLRTLLTIWSTMLAVFSIFGAIRTIPEFIHTFQTKGFGGGLCDNEYLFGPTRVWAWLFVMSKLFEFGDTIFVILRKQPLVLLHWYHHTTVMVYTWFSLGELPGPGRTFMVMNFIVHSFMYTYYALRAMGIRLPKVISILITTLQISQMMVGLVSAIKVYMIRISGQPCHQSWRDVYACMIMYASYFVLFALFFYKAYLTPKKTKIN